MAVTQAQMLVDFRDHLGDINSNQKSDYQLILAMQRAYRTAWPDWYLEVRDNDTYTGYASLPPGTLSVPVPTSLVGGEVFNIFGRTNIYNQGTAFTIPITSSTFTTTTAHGMAVNQQVQLNGGSLPGGFASRTLYYVKTVPTSTTFTLSATSGGAAITSTTAGSGYVGNYVDSTYDYTPFNQWYRGIRVDPTVVTSTNAAPRIRFSIRDGIPFELQVEGRAQLSYPMLNMTLVATNSTITYTGATATPQVNDIVYLYGPSSVIAATGFNVSFPYYVTNPTATTFQLSSLVNGGSILSPSVSGNYQGFAGGNTLPGTDFTHFTNFLLWQGEVFARTGLQRSGNLDRRAQAQRRLLAQDLADKERSHRMQPKNQTLFSWDA